jgi:hypothetical protein
MRLLLCDLETGKFYKTPGLWVQSPGEAAAFADMECLLIEREKIHKVNLAVIALDEDDRPRYAVRLWGFGESKSGF